MSRQRLCADPRVGQFCNGPARPAQHHHDIHGFVDGGASHADGVQVRQAGRIEHVGAGGGERLQTPDRVRKVGAAAEEVFRPCSQKERPARGGLCRGPNAVDRKLEVVDR